MYSACREPLPLSALPSFSAPPIFRPQQPSLTRPPSPLSSSSSPSPPAQLRQAYPLCPSSPLDVKSLVLGLRPPSSFLFVFCRRAPAGPPSLWPRRPPRPSSLPRPAKPPRLPQARWQVRLPRQEDRRRPRLRRSRSASTICCRRSERVALERSSVSSLPSFGSGCSSPSVRARRAGSSAVCECRSVLAREGSGTSLHEELAYRDEEAVEPSRRGTWTTPRHPSPAQLLEKYALRCRNSSLTLKLSSLSGFGGWVSQLPSTR